MSGPLWIAHSNYESESNNIYFNDDWKRNGREYL